MVRMRHVLSCETGGRLEFDQVEPTILVNLRRPIGVEVFVGVNQPEVLHFRLIYTHENFFPNGPSQVHEYGWFYLVELKTTTGLAGQDMPHPDHPDLRLAWVPVSSLATVSLFP